MVLGSSLRYVFKHCLPSAIVFGAYAGKPYILFKYAQRKTAISFSMQIKEQDMSIDTEPLVKIEKPTDAYLERESVLTWPIWTKEVSKFDWHYDQKEICYLLEGVVEVSYSENGKDKIVEFKAGDMVTFSQGLSCFWNIKEAVRKHYKFE